jgi:hypothetical protein
VKAGLQRELEEAGKLMGMFKIVRKYKNNNFEIKINNYCTF